MDELSRFEAFASQCKIPNVSQIHRSPLGHCCRVYVAQIIYVICIVDGPVNFVAVSHGKCNNVFSAYLFYMNRILPRQICNRASLCMRIFQSADSLHEVSLPSIEALDLNWYNFAVLNCILMNILRPDLSWTAIFILCSSGSWSCRKGRYECEG